MNKSLRSWGEEGGTKPDARECMELENEQFFFSFSRSMPPRASRALGKETTAMQAAPTDPQASVNAMHFHTWSEKIITVETG